MADLTCYKCGGQVTIAPSAGGRGEMTIYSAICYGAGQYQRDGCGMSEDNLSDDGTKRSAMAQYHRIAVAKALTR